MDAASAKARGERAAPAPLPAALGRNAPLVPVDSAESRALVGVIAILAFLAALCACAAELVGAASAQWQSSVEREMTIQVRPVSQRDLEADVARVAELARAAPGVAEARAMGKQEAERLLEPWLGSGLDLGDLPVPRLVILKLDAGHGPDSDELRRRLAEVPSATLDDHGLWLARLSTMARAVVGGGGRDRDPGLRRDRACRRLRDQRGDRRQPRGRRRAAFRRRRRRLHRPRVPAPLLPPRAQGGLAGGGLALLLITLCGFLLSAWRGGATRDQIEALFGAFAVGWQGYASVVAVALTASFMTGAVTRITVLRILRRLSGRLARS